MDSIIEMIQSTTDAKTLASPKVLAVNGQEARIQIGEQLGYLTTTTTQTSTLQDVQFIDLGVVLTVTPVISRNGQILMTQRTNQSFDRFARRGDDAGTEKGTLFVSTIIHECTRCGAASGGIYYESKSVPTFPAKLHESGMTLR